MPSTTEVVERQAATVRRSGHAAVSEKYRIALIGPVGGFDNAYYATIGTHDASALLLVRGDDTHVRLTHGSGRSAVRQATSAGDLVLSASAVRAPTLEVVDLWTTGLQRLRRKSAARGRARPPQQLLRHRGAGEGAGVTARCVGAYPAEMVAMWQVCLLCSVD
ncbi:hypothetical protein AB1Y20_013046 [Prymnesium parvum]|uniref:Uncharacterized protein n=1 Tax=Prymnesium parvum TaxID=97485 RepID=A0AB34IJJ2_PRYPA